MEIRFENKADFIVRGYAVETILSSSEKDVGQLWEKHKEDLLAIPESKSSLYGVMWYTENHKYFYLLGIKNEKPPKSDMTAVTIQAANFAIATVPGKYFEFYNAEGACELWTPVTK
ncbi:MAG: GyrI-like domain-containing protein [Clostridiales bacterium]|jgi:AraC family transcriptional regulator|nr:GyrI-like domain-containing protein [Clostridiales bacterium]